MKTIFPFSSSLLLLLFLLSTTHLTAQEVDGVRFVERGDTLSVYFNLSGNPDTWYDIDVQVVENRNGQVRILKPSEGSISGDYKGVLPGQSKLIRWDFGGDPQIENTDNVFLNLLAKEALFVDEQADVKLPEQKKAVEETPVLAEASSSASSAETSKTKTLSEKEKKKKAKLIKKKQAQKAKEARKQEQALAKSKQNDSKEEEETTELTKTINSETQRTTIKEVTDTTLTVDAELLEEESLVANKVKKAKRQLFASKPIPKDAKVWNEIITANPSQQAEAFTLNQLLIEKQKQKRPQRVIKKKPENPFLMDARIALGLLPQDGELPQGVVLSINPIYIGESMDFINDIAQNRPLKTKVAPPTPLKGKAKRMAIQKEKAKKAAAKRQAKVDAIAAKKQAKIDRKRARKEKERPFWDLFKPVKKEEGIDSQKAAYSKYAQWRKKQ